MKQFLKNVAEWKTSVCLLYTAAMVLYLFFCTIFNYGPIPLTMLWSLLIVSLLSTLIQGICFSNWMIKKMHYTWRSLLFVALFLPLMSFVAWKMEWFPTEQPGAWAMFIGIFFLIFLVMTVGFEIYFQSTGRKYDGLIGHYRREKEEENH